MAKQGARGSGVSKEYGAGPGLSTESMAVGDGVADLEISVHRSVLPDGVHHRFIVRARDHALDVHNLDFQSKPLKGDPYLKVQGIYKQIEGFRLFTQRERRVAIERLASKGAALFKELIPPPLQEILWRLQDKVDTLRIESSEDHWIPWELLKLEAKIEGEWRQGPFLCEAFATCRWYPGISVTSAIPLRSIATVAPGDSSLAGASREVASLASLAGHGRQVTPIAPRYLELTEALASGQYDGWHFAGHGAASRNDWDQSAFELEGGERLTPEDLNGETANLGRSRPLVFLNACRTSNGSPGLINVTGWAEQFLQVGAGAFIGTLWTVYDKAAESFGRVFYREFLAGLPFAKALRIARSETRDAFPGDPSFLAYVGFGNPLASINERSESDHIYEEPSGLKRPRTSVIDTLASSEDQDREILSEIRRVEEEIEDRSLQSQPTDALRAQLLEYKRSLLRSGVGIPVSSGSILNDRYRLGDVLGSGGFGMVWKAYDRRHRRTVAVKVLHGQWARDLTRRARFFRGARKMASLSHPNVVRVMEEEAEYMGNYYFVMEYMPEGDLDRAVREGRLFPDEAAALVLEVGYALHNAHESRLVHRDVKPSNLLLDSHGQAKLSDFDLVRASDTTGVTRTGGLGSYMYIAPEALELAKEAGASADLFSLAMTMMYCLHGDELPMSAFRSPATFLLSLDFNDAVKAVLLKALEWDPRKRFPDVVTLCRAFERAMPVASSLGLASFKERRKITMQRIPPSSLRPALAEIPAGSFLMGSPPNEAGRHADEELHKVDIRSSFWMSATPVTQAQYQAVMGSNPAYFGANRRGANTHPVEQVSWVDAARYCNELSRLEGLSLFYEISESSEVEGDPSAAGYRLPSEEQWEYACLAGAQTRFWLGDREQHLFAVGWVYGVAGGRTRAVGKKLGNPWGLYDLHGNVWEWCSNWYKSYPSDSPAESENEPRKHKVIRGGSHFLPADWARAASRGKRCPDEKDQFVGFRIVRPAVGKEPELELE